MNHLMSTHRLLTANQKRGNRPLLKNALFRLALSLALVQNAAVPMVASLWLVLLGTGKAGASDVKAQLNSNDGSTAFEVRDSGDAIVGSMDSNGNILMIGSGTITNGFIVSGGNVGLGTQEVTSLLDVFNGSITVRGTNAGIGINGSDVITTATSDNATRSSTQTFTGQNTFINQLTVTGGNVGIGTAVPSSLFDVRDGSITIRGTNAGLIVESGNVGIGTAAPSSGFDLNGGSITVRGSNAGMIIESGNVGIGSTNPTHRFNVFDGTASVTNGNFYAASVGFGIITRSPDGNCWRLDVSDGGVLSANSLTCP